MKKPICKTCYFKWRFEDEDWCEIIENEGGGSIEAILSQCSHYLKKGNEPKWLCCACGHNTYGKEVVIENKKGKVIRYWVKWWCADCYHKAEKYAKEWNEKLKQVKILIL